MGGLFDFVNQILLMFAKFIYTNNCITMKQNNNKVSCLFSEAYINWQETRINDMTVANISMELFSFMKKENGLYEN